MRKKRKVDTWVNCPECDIKLKQEHLSTHMKRVHNKKIEDEEIESLETLDKKSQENKIPLFISKKMIGLIIIIVVILAFSIFVYFTNNDSNSNGQNDTTKKYVVSIEGKGNYSSIQEAINLASDNDIIIVSSGAYLENIKINKSIELIGEDKNTTIIEGNGSGIVIDVLVDNVKLSGFTIKNGGPKSEDESNAGVVIRSRYNTISDCNISSNKNYGLYLCAHPKTTNNIIKFNTFSNNSHGIYINNANVNNIISNTFSKNSYGIYTTKANTINFSSNTFADNKNYGLYLLSNSNDNIILNNIFTENNYAIKIQTSEKNTVINNQIMNNKYGLKCCCGSENNIAYNNVFINNTDWNADDDLDNAWDNGYPSGGNYWDDYSGVDNYQGPNQDIPGSDGIGDTPYTENLKKGDNFPLMEPI